MLVYEGMLTVRAPPDTGLGTDVGTALRLRDNLFEGTVPTSLVLSHWAVSLSPLDTQC